MSTTNACSRTGRRRRATIQQRGPRPIPIAERSRSSTPGHAGTRQCDQFMRWLSTSIPRPRSMPRWPLAALGDGQAIVVALLGPRIPTPQPRC
jgi:hypothetical protein